MRILQVKTLMLFGLFLALCTPAFSANESCKDLLEGPYSYKYDAAEMTKDLESLSPADLYQLLLRKTPKGAGATALFDLVESNPELRAKVNEAIESHAFGRAAQNLGLSFRAEIFDVINETVDHDPSGREFVLKPFETLLKWFRQENNSIERIEVPVSHQKARLRAREETTKHTGIDPENLSPAQQTSADGQFAAQYYQKRIAYHELQTERKTRKRKKMTNKELEQWVEEKMAYIEQLQSKNLLSILLETIELNDGRLVLDNLKDAKGSRFGKISIDYENGAEEHISGQVSWAGLNADLLHRAHFAEGMFETFRRDFSEFTGWLGNRDFLQKERIEEAKERAKLGSGNKFEIQFKDPKRQKEALDALELTGDKIVVSYKLLREWTESVILAKRTSGNEELNHIRSRRIDYRLDLEQRLEAVKHELYVFLSNYQTAKKFETRLRQRRYAEQDLDRHRQRAARYLLLDRVHNAGFAQPQDAATGVEWYGFMHQADHWKKRDEKSFTVQSIDKSGKKKSKKEKDPPKIEVTMEEEGQEFVEVEKEPTKETKTPDVFKPEPLKAKEGLRGPFRVFSDMVSKTKNFIVTSAVLGTIVGGAVGLGELIDASPSRNGTHSGYVRNDTPIKISAPQDPTNSGMDEGKVLTMIVTMQKGNDTPRLFNLPSKKIVADSENSTLVYPKVYNRKTDYYLSFARPLLSDSKGRVVMPIPEGFEPVSISGIETSKSGSYLEGYMRQHLPTGLYYGDFGESWGNQKLDVIVKFRKKAPKDIKTDSWKTEKQLTHLDKTKLQSLAIQLKKAQMTVLADRIFDLVENKESISVVDIENALQTTTFYTHDKELAFGFAMVDSTNPFKNWTRFLGPDGNLYYECDGGNTILKRFFDEYFGKDSNVEVINVRSLVIDKYKKEIAKTYTNGKVTKEEEYVKGTGDEIGHLQTMIIVDNGRIKLTLDGTSVIKKDRPEFADSSSNNKGIVFNRRAVIKRRKKKFSIEEKKKILDLHTKKIDELEAAKNELLNEEAFKETIKLDPHGETPAVKILRLSTQFQKFAKEEITLEELEKEASKLYPGSNIEFKEFEDLSKFLNHVQKQTEANWKYIESQYTQNIRYSKLFNQKVMQKAARLLNVLQNYTWENPSSFLKEQETIENSVK